MQEDAQSGNEMVISPAIVDSFGRIASKLRISVTDRCNFRCDFCMPVKPIWLDHSEVLTFEEITRIASILSRAGISKVRLTGGEPLLRRDIEKLVGMLTSLPGIKSVSMTTNGVLLKEKARVLKEQDISGITISLHSLRRKLYDEITGTQGMFERVLEGIEVAKSLAIKPLKINCVVTRGCNDNEILDFAALANDSGLTVRFIEYMPFDGTKFWDVARVVSGKEIIERVASVYPLTPLRRERGSTAMGYGFTNGSEGEIATVTSMTRPFCSDCDRIRLKADGNIVPCLFSKNEYDVKSLLRGGASDIEIAEFIRRCFMLKFEGVESLIKRNVELKHIRPMHTIGG